MTADGSGSFDPRRDGAGVEAVAPGEVVWRDDRGVTCRRVEIAPAAVVAVATLDRDHPDASAPASGHRPAPEPA